MATSTIDPDSKVITLVNVFTVEPNNQQRLVDLLIEATEKVMSQKEGFISAMLHKIWMDIQTGKSCTMEK